MKKQKEKKAPVKIIILMVVIGCFTSCGKSDKDGDRLPKTGVTLEEKQHEIATEMVKELRAPIDMAKEVAEKEAQRVAEQQAQANQ